jgi:hypothetical protein
MVRSVPSAFGNAGTMQERALTGDLPGMGALVARGVAIDVPFWKLPVESDLVQPPICTGASTARSCFGEPRNGIRR